MDNNNTAVASILVVEDDARVASLLRTGLEESGYSVMSAYDAPMGLRLFRSGNYDLVISDIVLPGGMDGLEMCRCIRRSAPGVPVLMLTALGSTDDKLEGFDAGADDYLVKPFDFRELLARIRVLLKRSPQDHARVPDSVEYADLRIDMKTRTVTRAGRDVKLSPKEFNLLLYMVSNPERLITRMEIALKVWNTTFDTGTNFIDVYINYLRKKIDRDFEPKLIHTRPGMGFILSSRQI